MTVGYTVVRPATAADVEAIIALEAVGFGADSWPERFVAEGVGGGVPTARYLVAEHAAGVVGFAAASVVADLAELQRLAVAPDHRRRGIATALVTGVADLACGHGATRLLLEVREDNAGALACYLAAGFEEIQRRPRYYRDGSAAIVLLRALTQP